MEIIRYNEIHRSKGNLAHSKSRYYLSGHGIANCGDILNRNVKHDEDYEAVVDVEVYRGKRDLVFLPVAPYCAVFNYL